MTGERRAEGRAVAPRGGDSLSQRSPHHASVQSTHPERAASKGREPFEGSSLELVHIA